MWGDQLSRGWVHAPLRSETKRTHPFPVNFATISSIALSAITTISSSVRSCIGCSVKTGVASKPNDFAWLSAA